MADYAAEGSRTNAGAVITERTGSAAADRVIAGSVILFRNTGAGTHVVTFTNAGTYKSLTVANRTLSMTAGQNKLIYVETDWAAADGYVPIAIDGTATEVRYSILGV